MDGLFAVSYVVLWLLFLTVAIGLLSVLRNLGVMYGSLEMQPSISSPEVSLPAGEVVPDVDLMTLAGESVAISEYCGVPTAILVVSPACSPCHALLKRVADGDMDGIDPLDPSTRHAVVIVSTGDQPRTATMIKEVGLSDTVPVLMDKSKAIAQKWGTTMTPTRVIVDPEMRLVRHLVGA